MNTKDIRTSTDPDLAGSYAAMERAARAAQDRAIKTNTGAEVDCIIERDGWLHPIEIKLTAQHTRKRQRGIT